MIRSKQGQADQYLRRLLHAPLPGGVGRVEPPHIEATGTLDNMTSRLHYSLFPTLMDHAIITPTSRYWNSKAARPP